MEKVRLFTKVGEYVTSAFIPPFADAPRAILWGSRLFFFKEKDAYYEDFWIATVITGQEIMQPNKEIPKVTAEAVGNDALLFGLPANLDEAVETFIDFYGTVQDFKTIKEKSEEDFVVYAHHGAGQFLRNSWYLWWSDGHKYREWPKSQPPLVKFFNDLGIGHADDMSSIVIRSAYRKSHNCDIDLTSQINKYKEYWKNLGYKDGIYKPQK